MTNETRLFSDLISKSKFFEPALISGSRSREDANQRRNVYQRVFSNFVDLKDTLKTFSGVTEMPLLSNQYFNATVSSYVQSFAGFLSIERAMDQQTALLGFLDVLGASDERLVMPNIGAEDFSNIGAKVTKVTAQATSTDAYTISLSKKIVPGSVTVTLEATTPVIFSDNRKGTFLAPPGILDANAASAPNVDYTDGTIIVTFGAGYTATTGKNIIVVATEDAAGTPPLSGTPTNYTNRFKSGFTTVQVATIPDLLIGEENLIAMAQMKKSLGIDPSSFLTGKLIELYTKLINKQLVAPIIANGSASPVAIDITHATTGYQDWRSQVDKFSARLIDVDGALAAKSTKGIRATAYVVGTTTADWFRKTKAIGKFVDNVASNYVNDLVGFYDGVPVLRHTDITATAGFAVHKTYDGQLAPVLRGIFLPLTNTPAVGNYNNPTQVANGVFYQEGIESIATALVQKFTVSADA